MAQVSRRKLIQKTLHYKKASFLRPSPVRLQDLLKNALDKLDVTQRHEEVATVTMGPDSTPTVVQQFVRLINSPRDLRGFQFGVLVLFTPGDHHLVIDALKKESGERAAELDVEKHPPPEGKHYLDTMLHFAVRDDHVVIIQSPALRARHLQDHLNWLLRNAGCIEETQSVFLMDEVNEETRKKLQQAPIKSMTLETEMVSGVEVEPDAPAGPAAMRAIGRGWDAIKGILRDTDYAPLTGRDFEQIPNIGVKIMLNVHGRAPAGTTNDKVMKSVMNALQEADGVRFKADLKGHGSLTNEDFYLFAKKYIGSFDGQLVQSEVYDRMADWLEALVHSGQISTEG